MYKNKLGSELLMFNHNNQSQSLPSGMQFISEISLSMYHSLYMGLTLEDFTGRNQLFPKNPGVAVESS